MCSDPNFVEANEVRPVVIDTNIVLDLLVFHDPGTEALRLALAAGQVRWLATADMREELLRVLGYPKIKARLDAQHNTAEQVMRQFDTQAQIRAEASRVPLRCQDPDDQKFLDLAVAHKATLLSKDRALLCLKKRLLVLSVRAQTALDL